MSLRNLPEDAIVMPKDVPHAVYAQTAFKMLLVVVKA